jgi:hypothetical protein
MYVCRTHFKKEMAGVRSVKDDIPSCFPWRLSPSTLRNDDSAQLPIPCDLFSVHISPMSEAGIFFLWIIYLCPLPIYPLGALFCVVFLFFFWAIPPALKWIFFFFFFLQYWGLNSGIHSCKAGALLLKPLHQPCLWGFFWDRVSWTICLRLASHCDPCASWVGRIYRHEPLATGAQIFLKLVIIKYVRPLW